MTIVNIINKRKKRIKLIKEKAEEYAPYTREDSWSRTQKCIIVQTSFEAGANYVLECIEEVTNICFDEELRNVIEQLKK